MAVLLLICVAWVYIVVLMVGAELVSPQGTLLGAFITLVMYGFVPLSIVFYIGNSAARRRARAKAEQGAQPLKATPVTSDTANSCSHASSDTLSPEREKH